MKKLLTLLFFLFASMNAYSENPTYTLTAKNFLLNSPTNDEVEFDIYIEHTNAPTTFKYGGGQCFIAFNPAIANSLNELRLTKVNSDLPWEVQPRSFTISSASNPSQSILRMGLNAFQGVDGSPILTGTSNPGTKILRVNLKRINGAFNTIDFMFQWRNPPTVAFATKFFAYVDDVGTDITTPATHFIDVSGISNPQPLLKINLKALAEGMYNPSLNVLNREDVVSLYLRNASSPYNIIDSAKTSIDPNTLSGIFTVPDAQEGIYYLIVKQLSIISTWSKSGGEYLYNDGSLNNYDFTTSASQAYGNNLKLVGTKYCMYSGEINKDGIIDGTDLATLDNDAYNLISGVRLSTDLNGDNIVDGSDFQLGDNNRRYITEITP